MRFLQLFLTLPMYQRTRKVMSTRHMNPEWDIGLFRTTLKNTDCMKVSLERIKY